VEEDRSHPQLTGGREEKLRDQGLALEKYRKKAVVGYHLWEKGRDDAPRAQGGWTQSYKEKKEGPQQQGREK